MKQKLKILHLEDEPTDAELVARELKNGGIDPEILVVSSKAKFVHELNNFSYDVILSDHSLASFNSHEALTLVKNAGITVPFILVTATMTDEFAAGAIKDGACDYILKDRLGRLPAAVINSIEKHSLTAEKDTKLAKANEEMRQLTIRLQLATQSAGMGIWEWDIKNDRLAWDEGMYQLYNTSGLQFASIYEGWISLVHADDRYRVNQDIQMAITGQQKYDTEFRVIWGDGTIHTIKATGIVDRDGTGDAIRMIGTNQDISKQKSAARETELIMDNMLHRNTELEQFAYIISHNLRAPIANIIGASSALADPELDAEDKKILNKGISDSVVRLDDVVKDLNNILEMKGEINKIKELVCFSVLVDDIKISLLNLIDKEKIEIKHDFADIDELLTLKPYLYSIFYNLISNSIKYRQQHVFCMIKISSKKTQHGLELTFSDNGMGIDLKKKGAQVFGLYKRFHTNIEGKGMGLYMVKAQVEALGGSISIKSAENAGTEFTVILNQEQ